jgi:hypothetical protein
MIEKLTPVNAGILLAAAIMALGAFCPILQAPIIGSMSYVAGGRGAREWISDPHCSSWLRCLPLGLVVATGSGP